MSFEGQLSPDSPTSPFSSSVQPIEDAMVVVDPVSTGANVAHSVAKAGIHVIAVFSGHTPPALLHMIDPSVRVDFVTVIEQDPTATTFDHILSKLKALPYNIVAVLAGSELGVECSDTLSNGLNLPLSNSLEKSVARRDKYTMGETIRAAGVRAVLQARVKVWADVEAFVEELNPMPFKVVIKPVKSAGSDGVYLCSSMADLKEKFNLIVGTDNMLGIFNDSAVVQEYLQGTEYVLDTVSRNGKHKLIQMWCYDKRPFRGAAFVYYGMTPLSCDCPEGKALFEYQQKVLDALEIRNGPGHAEIIMTKTGPCLVEVGARPHGGEGTFIVHANIVWGQNQVEAMVAAYKSQKDFDAVTERCEKTLSKGFKVYLVSHVAGKLEAIKYLDDIRKLSSFIKFDAMPHVGDNILVTKDCFSMVGSVMLANVDQQQLDTDAAYVRSLESTMFDVSNENDKAASIQEPHGPVQSVQAK